MGGAAGTLAAGARWQWTPEQTWSRSTTTADHHQNQETPSENPEEFETKSTPLLSQLEQRANDAQWPPTAVMLLRSHCMHSIQKRAPNGKFEILP